jgi:hypothetical protein
MTKAARRVSGCHLVSYVVLILFLHNISLCSGKATHTHTVSVSSDTVRSALNSSFTLNFALADRTFCKSAAVAADGRDSSVNTVTRPLSALLRVELFDCRQRVNSFVASTASTPDLGPTSLHSVQERTWGPLASMTSKTGLGAHFPPKRSRPDLGPTHPSTLLVRGALSYSVKWRRRESDQ